LLSCLYERLSKKNFRTFISTKQLEPEIYLRNNLWPAAVADKKMRNVNDNNIKGQNESFNVF
jgi:hypothetical protein